MIAVAQLKPLTITQAKQAAYDQSIRNVALAIPEMPGKDFVVSMFRQPMFYHDNPLFTHEGKVKELFEAKVGFDVEIVSDIWNRILAGDHEGPKAKQFILTRDEEKIMFLRFNYARKKIVRLFRAIQYRATRTHKQLNPCEIQSAIRWTREWKQDQDILIVANLGLVWTMRKIFQGKAYDNSAPQQVVLVDDEGFAPEGYRAIMRAVNKFDVARGFRFATYACRSIMQNCGREREKENSIKSHEFNLLPPSDSPEKDPMEFFPDKDGRPNPEILDLRFALKKSLLSPVEVAIIHEHFFNGKTLPTVARHCAHLSTTGTMSRERARQIRDNALNKLREIMRVRVKVE